MAVFTQGSYNCACAREVCDWTCTTYATMMSNLVPNTAEPFKNLSKPYKSNADRIRAMTDEELAEWIASQPIECDCSALKCKGCGDDCYAAWLDWLKQEVEE